MAATARPTEDLVLAAAERQDWASAGMRSAEEAGVLQRTDGRLGFTYPLLGSTVYAGATPHAGRSVHGRLAELVDDPEERARHLALAVNGPHMHVARALEEAGGHARARGAPDAAAELLELARKLTPPEDGAGLPRRSEVGDDAETRAAIHEHLAWVGIYRGDLAFAAEHTRASMDWVGLVADPAVQAESLSTFGMVEFLMGRPAQALMAEAVRLEDLAMAEDQTTVITASRTCHGLQLLWAGELDAAREVLRQELTEYERLGRYVVRGTSFSATWPRWNAGRGTGRSPPGTLRRRTRSTSSPGGCWGRATCCFPGRWSRRSPVTWMRLGRTRRKGFADACGTWTDPLADLPDCRENVGPVQDRLLGLVHAHDRAEGPGRGGQPVGFLAGAGRVDLQVAGHRAVRAGLTACRRRVGGRPSGPPGTAPTTGARRGRAGRAWGRRRPRRGPDRRSGLPGVRVNWSWRAWTAGRSAWPLSWTRPTMVNTPVGAATIVMPSGTGPS
jgi:hypothetical protein